MASTIYSEIFILIDILISYILRNHLVRHIARTAAELAARPQVPPPKLLLDVRKFRHQMVGRFSFQPLQQPTDRHLRRNRHEHVYVVFGHMPLHDGYIMLGAMSRIRSLTRVATSAVKAGRLCLVIHTKCRWISNTVCAPRRYSGIPPGYPRRAR